MEVEGLGIYGYLWQHSKFEFSLCYARFSQRTKKEEEAEEEEEKLEVYIDEWLKILGDFLSNDFC